MGADEFRELVVDLLQLVEDLRARGLRADVEASADGVAPADRAVEALGRRASPTRRVSVDAWVEVAAEARGREPVGAGGMEAVRKHLGACTRCPLSRTRNNLVFGVGDPNADLVIIGEGPGYQEDRTGEPFVGPAGQMLDRMLINVLGLQRSQVYILNVVKCRPPRNRNPHPDEIEACRPFWEAQIRACRPKLALVLGSVAFRAMTRSRRGITAARGTWHVWRDPKTDREVPFMPTFHPAYLLRKPQDKRLTFEDLKALRTRYDQLGGRR